MKVKQNLISLIIGMVLMLPIGASAAAIAAQSTSVKILVDGKPVQTMIYNIEGRKCGVIN